MISLDAILFYLFGAVTVASSLAVVTQRNPMHSVLFLIGSFLALAGLYINLDSPFTAVTQIIVYAGAIMVLFLFVVMLLNAPREDVASPYGPACDPIGRASASPRISEYASSTIRTIARTVPNRVTAGCRRGCARSHVSASSCGAFSNMTTNRNSTMIAPA